MFVGNLIELLLIPLELKWWVPNSHLAPENWWLENYFPLKECLFSGAVFVLGSLYDTLIVFQIFQSNTICLTCFSGEKGDGSLTLGHYPAISIPYPMFWSSGGWLGLWQHDLDGSLNWWTDGPAFPDQLLSYRSHENPQKNILISLNWGWVKYHFYSPRWSGPHEWFLKSWGSCGIWLGIQMCTKSLSWRT